MTHKTSLSTKRAIRWCAVLIIIVLYFMGGFERAELITIDHRYHLKNSPADPAILLVLIDQTSLKQFPRWPWPRHYYADVIDTLKEGGATVIGLDLDFSSRSQDKEDQRLTNAVFSAGNVVLSVFHEDRILKGKIRIKSASLPFSELASAAKGIGSILFPVDSDGTMRRAYWTDEILGQRVLTLSGEIARQFLDLSDGEMGDLDPQQIRLGKHRIRTQTDGTFYLNFIGASQQFESVSFGDVLEKRIASSIFKDKMVLIGASSMELRDIWKTPFGLTPGVAIQANALQTLLSGLTLYRPRPWATLILILSMVLILDLSLAGSFKRPGSNVLRRFLVFTTLTGMLAAIYYLTAVGLFIYGRLIVDMVPVYTTILVYYLLASFAFNLFSSQSVQVKTMSLSAIHSVGNLSTKTKPLDHSINLISEILEELLGIKTIIMELYNPAKRAFIGRISKGVIFGKNGEGLTQECQDWIEKALNSEESVVVPNLNSISLGSNSPDSTIRSSLFIPLMTHNNPQGVLHLHSPDPRAFGEDDIKFLYTLCNQLAMNIENLELIKETKRLFNSSIGAFSSALELRDNATEGHSQRVATYAMAVGMDMGLDPKQLEILHQGALLHDIGKIGIPDAILRKPKKLTKGEMKIIQKHSEYGYKMLKNIDFPEEVAIILLHHHEQYDGTGYPSGLKNEAISIYSRIFMVADTYDAMRSDRPYHKGVPHRAAIQEIKRCSGTQFDPDVVRAFLRLPGKRFREISLQVNEAVQSKGLVTVFSDREKTH